MKNEMTCPNCGATCTVVSREERRVLYCPHCQEDKRILPESESVLLERIQKEKKETEERIRRQKNGEEVKRLKKVLRLILVGWSILLVLSISINMNSIIISFDSSDLQGRDYKEVEAILKQTGFLSITSLPLGDQRVDPLHLKTNKVSAVLLGEKKVFEKNERHSKDEPITVFYHSFPED